MSKIPTGLNIHNIEMQPGGGAKLCRSAGVGAQVVENVGSCDRAHPMRRPTGTRRGRRADPPGGEQAGCAGHITGRHEHGNHGAPVGDRNSLARSNATQHGRGMLL